MRARRHGFTLVELMIVVAIIGILAAIAIPNFLRFQLKSKTSEAKINLSAIRVAEQAYSSEWGTYTSAAQAPNPIPGAAKATLVSADFDEIGWAPVGDVFFSYAVAVSADGSGFTIEAAGDIDGDGVVQFWGYAKHDLVGVKVPSVIGCNVAMLVEDTVSPCGPLMGQDIF